MGERRGSRLAARLRAQLDANREAAAKREREKKAKEADGRAERKQLLADLAAFGEAVGHLNVTVAKDVVILGYGKSTLRFEAQGIADRVRVKGLDPEPRLFFHSDLNRWVVSRETGRGPEDQELLFDVGLESLLAEALSLQPIDEDHAAPSDETPVVDADDRERTL